MFSEVEPSSFVVDFMKRRDIVNLIRQAESNCALRSRLDILVSVWQLATANNSRGNRLLRKGVDDAYNLARSSVNLEDARGEWKKWEEQRALILADAEKEARTTKGSKKGFRVQEKSHINDVARFEAAFGIKDAVILAKLTDVSSWYASPRPRKELILYHLDPEYGQSGQCTTLSGTKRAGDQSADGSKDHVEDRMAKRVCHETRTSIEQESIIIPKARRSPDTNLLTGSAGVQHPVVQPTWSGNGEASALIYDGQFDISGSTDRWIHYRWNAISAVDTMSLTETLPTSSDVQWLYYDVHRSKIQKLPFAALSRIIQRSRHWGQEGEQGLTASACLRLAFPRGPAEDYGAYCRLSCIVPGADAPEVK